MYEDKLRAIFPPNTEVPMILRHVSRSGMLRAISVLDPADMRDVSWMVADALGLKMHPSGGIKVHGCGMDMGWHLAYSLARHLYGEPGYTCNGSRGYGPAPEYANTPDAPRCLSNDHSNGAGYVAGTRHSNPGYALGRRWL